MKVSLYSTKRYFMRTYTLVHDLKVFGMRVESFPAGIGDAFSAIMQRLPNGQSRSYYGLSTMDANGKVLYYATAEEKSPGEASQYGYETYTIEKGRYLTETVYDWRSKTDTIKDVFHGMMQDKSADDTKPCVEWYKDDNEMVCMLQMDAKKELFAAVDDATAALMELLLPLSEEQINSIPFKDSWTAAQLAVHVTKSNNAIVQAMDMQGKMPGRNATDRVAELKSVFLDFNNKLKSPEFIVPKPGEYEKEKLLATFKKSNDQLRQKRDRVNLAEAINFPAFGEITRIELFHFVLYHTQRHIHQLKNMLRYL